MGRARGPSPGTGLTRIRQTLPGDAELLPAIERSSGTIFRLWPGLEWIADDDVQSADRHRALIAHGIALVAEGPGGQIIGFLNAEPSSDALHVWQAAVHHDHHRRRIGSRLMEAAQRHAVDRRLKTMTLTAFRNVPWNEPYYRKLGFRTLSDEALDSRLEGILEAEARAGLPMAQRCAMMKQL